MSLLAFVLIASHVISDAGVGPVLLGAPLPKSHRNAAKLTAQYETTFYADAQPLEGFHLDEPAVFAAVDGPFTTWGQRHAPAKPPRVIKEQAVKRALAGKLAVRMIVVRDERLTTAAGVHVASAWSEVKAAYPEAKIVELPGLWEEPTCLARVGQVQFFFKRCEKGGTIGAEEKVIRIVVREWR